MKLRLMHVVVTLVVCASGVGSLFSTVASGGNAATPKTLDKLCRLPYVKGAVVRFPASDGAELVGAVAGRVGSAFCSQTHPTEASATG